MALSGKSNAEKIWNFCKSKGFSDCGVAGALANLNAESGLNPKNLQDYYQDKLGFTDDSYVSAIDSGAYTKEQFIYDEAGAFICQWTYWSRKKALYEYAKSKAFPLATWKCNSNFYTRSCLRVTPLSCLS